MEPVTQCVKRIDRETAAVMAGLRVFANVESLQADFPGFVIWGETIRGRVTYVAQAVDRATGALRGHLRHPGPAAVAAGGADLARDHRLRGVARKLHRDRERQAEAALGVGPPFP